jgi:hypothetical protein
MYACVGYCAVLCQRAPSCGSFDPVNCRTGCSLMMPSICNRASVAARTCDQLKPELRDYDDLGRIVSSGDNSAFEVGMGSLAGYGLCTTASDCTSPLGCAAATNTCTTCTSDDDCKQSFGKYACMPTGCAQIQCRTNTDCTSTLTATCNAETNKCVACLTDAECTSSFSPHCEPTTNRCVACRTSADCKAPTPTCTSNYCR